jgi:hypothetical protein
MSSKDLVIPKIQIAQPTSQSCKEGNAKPGEILHSLTKEVIVPKGSKLELLPILCVGSWVVSRVVPTGFEFLRKEPLTEANDSDEWNQEGFEDGAPIVTNKCLSFLVLPVTGISGFPYFIDFQKTNKQAGKILSTIIQENGFRGLPAPARTVNISTVLKSYKNNSWFAFQVASGRDASEGELAACKKWFDIFSAKQAEVTHDDGIS